MMMESYIIVHTGFLLLKKELEYAISYFINHILTLIRKNTQRITLSEVNREWLTGIVFLPGIYLGFQASVSIPKPVNL